MGQKLSGHCLCGAVKFTAVPEAKEMGVCHCEMCQRWTGGVYMAVHCEAVDIEDESSLGVYSSSDFAERVFCKVCGTSLFWRMKDGSFTAVSMQALDDRSGFKFTSEIFVDEQPSIYAFSNNTHRMTGPEVIAQFAQQQDPQNG